MADPSERREESHPEIETVAVYLICLISLGQHIFVVGTFASGFLLLKGKYELGILTHAYSSSTLETGGRKFATSSRQV